MTTRDFITKFKTKYKRLPSQVELSKTLGLSSGKAIQAIIDYTREPQVPVKKKVAQRPAMEQRNNTVLFLRIALIVLFMMVLPLSVYFTALWFMGKFHWIISMLFSVTVVLYMVISPQTLRYIHNPLIKGIAFLSFLIAVFFSMGTTVSGQYNKTTERAYSGPDKALVFQSTLKEEEELEGLIKDAQDDKKIHQSTITLLSPTEEKRKENWQQIATERSYIKTFDERIDKLRGELKGVRTVQVSSEAVEEKRDFYLFISKLTGMEVSFTEFVIIALPALFIDMISALCLNLVLFIGKKKRK